MSQQRISSAVPLCEPQPPARSVVVRPRKRHLQIAEWIGLALLMDGDEGPVIRKLENPDGRVPWGKTAPDDVAEHGLQIGRCGGRRIPTRYGNAVSYNPRKGVEEMLKADPVNCG